ncbi:MAG: hypothetical protein HZA84_01680 [Thaumarchaeota archaeon]|nr:hypothetical protein [Nitrososphaerota archaeon]
MKTTKTILFAALVLTLILPVTGVNVAAAVLDKIPDGKLLERTADKWHGQYKNVEEFTVRQNAIREYVTADLQNNGWNQFMVKENIRIHNFDTMIGKVGYGHELVALYAAKDRMLGIYDVTEPVAKFHDWLLSKYAIPATVEEIDARITTIVSDNYLHLAPQDVSAFNDMANQGNVPPQLVEQDPEYWIMVANVAVCQYAENCDHEGMKKIFDNELYRTQNTLIPTLDIMGFFLPEASAITNALHSGYLYANPNSCDYGTCSRSASGYQANPINLSIYSPSGGHSYGSLYVYASSCSSVSGVTTKVTGTVDMGATWNFSKTGGSCALQESYYSLPNPGASYLWTVSATHSAWT